MNDIAEEPSFTTTPNTYAIAPFVPIAVALVGVILGATALFVSLSGKKPNDISGEGLEATTALQSRLSQVEMQLVQLSDTSSNNTEELRAMSDQVQKALNEASRSIAQLQSQMSTTSQPRAATASQQSAVASSTSYKNYSIQSGDTFSKIAQNHGISTQTLLALNPGVDPKRLQIGQGIKVPDSKH